MAKKLNEEQIKEIQSKLAQKEKKSRSAWGKAVLQDAQWLLDNALEYLEYSEEKEIEISEATLLNGARSWEQYSEGGSAFVYDMDIAKHYCSPSELKKVTYKEGGVKDMANPRENWLQVQARALRQAWWAIRDEVNQTTEFSMFMAENEKVGDTKRRQPLNFDIEESDRDEYWDVLVEYGIATQEELELVTSINGYSIETLDDILYARTGNRSWEQYCEENEIDNIFEDSDDDDDDSNFDLFGSLRQTDYYETGKGRLLFSMVFDSNDKEIELYTRENGKKNIICRAKNQNNMPILRPRSNYRDYVKVDSKLEKDFVKFVCSCDGFSNFSIIEETADIVKGGADKLLKTTDKIVGDGGMLMF